MKKIDFTYTVVGEICFVDKKDMEMLMSRLSELGVEVKTVRPTKRALDGLRALQNSEVSLPPPQPASNARR